MKVSIYKTHYDKNSTKRVDLCINGNFYGTYSYGTYSKWYIRRREKGEGPVPSVERFVTGLVYKNFDVDLRMPGAENLISQKISDGNIGAWFESYMEEELAKNRCLTEDTTIEENG